MNNSGSAASLALGFEADGQLDALHPPAIVPESAARAVLLALAGDDVLNGGHWLRESHVWRLFDRPWTTPDGPGRAVLLGSLYVIHAAPTPHEVTITHTCVTAAGGTRGLDVTALCDAALAPARLTLSSCPRLSHVPPPRGHAAMAPLGHAAHAARLPTSSL